ncbi:hypothetical protein KC573_00720 [candidate division WWE3 bacterium]|uniref:Uncharacterized protein n=1 Tax=candidate division WWE3 bacterium TaxID=2053526 RepID=A0A955LW77_UNCKA|nr:hypothetical protein [candidate division WWE3 bacterium]
MTFLNIRQIKTRTVFFLLFTLVVSEAVLLGYLLYKTNTLSEDNQTYPTVRLSENITDNSRKIDISKPDNIPTPTPIPSPTLIPTPTPTAQPTISNNPLCINYGHQTNDYNLSPDGPVQKDLDTIKSSGIDCIRIAYSDWNYSGMLDLAVLVKSNGFRVILGGHYGNVGIDDFKNYRSKVVKQAVWAQDHGIDQFSLGNEQEFKLETSKDNWYEFLLELAGDVNQIYSGVISYETSGNFFDFWLDKPLGDIDVLGFNMYSGYETNARRIQDYIAIHGKNRVYISETNADLDLTNLREDNVHAQHVKQNTLTLLNLGIPVYYFTYATCEGVEDFWGLYQCGVMKQPLTASALGIK